MNQKSYIILIVLLSMRVLFNVGHFIRWMINEEPLLALVALVMTVVYLISLIGVATRDKWGSKVAMIVAAIDIFIGIFGGTFVGIAGIVGGSYSLALIFFGFVEHKRLTYKSSYLRDRYR